MTSSVLFFRRLSLVGMSDGAVASLRRPASWSRCSFPWPVQSSRLAARFAGASVLTIAAQKSLSDSATSRPAKSP